MGSLSFLTQSSLKLRVGRKSGGADFPLALHFGRRLAPPLDGLPSLKLRNRAAPALKVFNKYGYFSFHSKLAYSKFSLSLTFLITLGGWVLYLLL